MTTPRPGPHDGRVLVLLDATELPSARRVYFRARLRHHHLHVLMSTACPLVKPTDSCAPAGAVDASRARGVRDVGNAGSLLVELRERLADSARAPLAPRTPRGTCA